MTEAKQAATPRRRAALAFIFVTVVLDMLALGMIVPVLPKLVEDFVGGNTARAAEIYGLFGTVWALMQFVFSPVLGALSDRFGRRGEGGRVCAVDGIGAWQGSGEGPGCLPGLSVWVRVDAGTRRHDGPTGVYGDVANAAGVGSNSSRKTEVSGCGSIREFDARLFDVCPGSTTSHVNQNVVHHQTGAGPDRSAYIGFDADSHRITVIATNDGVLKRAIAVHVRFDTEQTVAELIVVADLPTTGEKAARWRCG